MPSRLLGLVWSYGSIAWTRTVGMFDCERARPLAVPRLVGNLAKWSTCLIEDENGAAFFYERCVYILFADVVLMLLGT
jgi:hypothetical protein